jgi:hypothetical protein
MVNAPRLNTNDVRLGLEFGGGKDDDGVVGQCQGVC